MKRWIAKLTKYYRVELIDDATLSQSRIFVFRPLKVITVILVAILVLVGGTTSLIFFVPAIRETIPGYINPDVKQQQEQLLDKVKMMGQQVEMRDSLIKTLQRSLLEGQALSFSPDSLANLALETPPSPPEDLTAISEAEADVSPAVETYEERASSAQFTSYQYSPLQNLFPPVTGGQISNEFDANLKHNGVDIVANENELVLAAADGFVIMAEYHEESGQVIGILSEGEVLTFYKHNRELYKKAGDFVIAGEPVAVMGNSGENSTGPHLHFEIWHKGIPVDPRQYIKFD